MEQKKKLWWIPQQILNVNADGRVFHTRLGKELYKLEMKEKLSENKEIDEDKTDANNNGAGGIKMSDNAEKK